MFVILLYNFVILSTSYCFVNLYNGHLQATTVLFTLNFTQGWLNYYWPLPALSCFFIVQQEQSNELSVSRILHTLLFVHSHTCLSLFFHTCYYWFTWNVFNVFVSVYRIHIPLVVFAFVAFSSSISNILMIFVFVAFA